MHELVARINKPELCYVFAKNAERNGHPELAIEAFRRAVDLRTTALQLECEVEQAAMRAIYAYEEALSYSKGKRTRATGTWQMVNKLGVLPTVAKRLGAKGVDEVAPVLKELGMEDYSFEAVRAAYPHAFEQQAA